jgi:hypothetical protein
VHVVRSLVLQTYTFFTESAARTFRAAAESIVPEEPSSGGGGTTEVLAVADRVLSRRSPADRRKLLLFLLVVEVCAIFRYGARFSNLPLMKRARFLALFENSVLPPFRQGFFGVKTFVLMGYYGSEVAWGELQYPGPRRDAPSVIEERSS